MTAAISTKPEKKMFSVPTVLVVRHDKTRWNTGNPDTDRAKGDKYDLPLSEDGKEQARKDATILGAHSIREIHHSPMLRAVQTARPIAERTGAKLVEVVGLRPWNIGYLAGQLRREIEDRVQYYIEHPRRPVPEGEPYQDFWRTVTDSLSSILKSAEGLEDEAIVTVAHSDGIEAFDALLHGTLPSAVSAKNGIDPGSILIVEKRGGKWKMNEFKGE